VDERTGEREGGRDKRVRTAEAIPGSVSSLRARRRCEQRCRNESARSLRSAVSFSNPGNEERREGDANRVERGRMSARGIASAGRREAGGGNAIVIASGGKSCLVARLARDNRTLFRLARSTGRGSPPRSFIIFDKCLNYEPS